ncbi:MAG: hypothetical protein DRQ61_02205 [Gammaproteobacteria bacterium]|nr:MAG: hypothetical protein DRQ56_03390 [Gammaproteobacteria bacterium]RLA24009.1 MAG: hypothetical protein DRQ61_02205 [Gammaproteobacteria bacterium]
MGFLEKNFGSKYNRRLPYTFEARINVLEDDETLQTHLYADSFCALTNRLKKQLQDPKQVEIYEVFHDREGKVPEESYMSDEGRWEPRMKLCSSLCGRYRDPDVEPECEFGDRERDLVRF